jgi:hypothetical protein
MSPSGPAGQPSGEPPQRRESGPLDWKMNHFTLHQPDGQPVALLRRIADEIEKLVEIDVYDIVFKVHWDGDDYVAEASVYFSPKDSDDSIETA